MTIDCWTSFNLFFCSFFSIYIANKIKRDSLIVKKAPLNDSNIQNGDNKCLDKFTSTKINKSTPVKDCENLNQLHSSPIEDDKENQENENLIGSCQKYQLRNTPNRKLTESGMKIYKEPRGSTRTSSRKVKRSRKSSLLINADSKGLEQSDVKLQGIHIITDSLKVKIINRL